MFIGKLSESCEGKLSVSPPPAFHSTSCLSNQEKTGMMGLTVQAMLSP